MQVATEVKELVCICCPLGCSLEVSLDDDGGVVGVSGYTCARGKKYALQEATDPERMVTAVVCAKGALEPVSVKTERPVPKADIDEVLHEVLALAPKAPVEAGQVLIDDVAGTGVPVVATKSVEAD